ncbi:MAG: efflux RND transporter periplasmic adaptor subunit [Candidatus Eisenbacteria bacterium]|nr:efflux RND transporter periplasmic adaptor subunit [Candidatus Eisenbacteria bacterium]
MRRKKALYVSLALFAALLAHLVAGCGAREETETAAERTPVQVVAADRERMSPTVEYSGTVEAARKALLGAEIQGRIEEMNVDVGDRIEEGELLATLASEQLTSARAQAVLANKEWERAVDLLEDKAITPQAYDRALTALEVARANHERIDASSKLRAPFGGVVTERYLEEGELYTVMPTGAGSPAIFELKDMSEVKVAFEVGARQLELVEKGLEAEVTVDAYPGRTFSGLVSRVDPSLDLMSRTATVEVTISNPDRVLRPGMFADILLSLKPRQALVVPRDTLMRQEGTGLFFVYVVEDGVAHRKNLELGEGFGANMEIVSGLSGGEMVVSAGRHRLHDGAEVEVVESGGAMGAAGTAEPAAESGAAESGKGAGAALSEDEEGSR